MTALLGAKKAAAKPSEIEEPPVIVEQIRDQQPKPHAVPPAKTPPEPKPEPSVATDTTSRLLEAKKRARGKDQQP